MPDRVISAEAVISARDNTGDAFVRIAKKLQEVGKGAKASVEIERMSKALADAKGQLAAIEKFSVSQTSFSAARAKFNATKQAVEQMGRVMRDTEAPTRKMQADYQRLQGDVSKAAAAFERQKTALLDAKHAAEGFGTPLGKIAAEQSRLRGVIDSTTKAIERQGVAEFKAAEAAAKAHAVAEKAAERRAHIVSHHGVVGMAMGAAAGAVSAHSVFGEIERTAHAGAELQHERIGLRNAGRTPKEIDAIERRSREVVRRLPTASTIENMRVIAETTPAFGSVEHAMDHLEFMQKAMSVLKASGGDHIQGGPAEVGRFLAKTFEERFTKSENFEKEASAMIPAMVASGGVFNPEQLYAFAQQAKGSLPNYSMRFLSRIAPSMIGAMGGDRAGTAANAFTSIVMGKVNDRKQAEEWERYGLLDDSKVIKKSGNVVSWRAGAVKNTELALSDPLAWAEQVALPAMERKGVKIGDRLALAIALGTMFRNQNGNMFANEIMQADSRARLHKDEGLTDRVGTTDEIYDRNLNDSTVALKALTASMQNLRGAVSDPVMGAASGLMVDAAKALNRVSDLAVAHPLRAATAGIGLAGGALAGSGVLAWKFATAGASLQTAATMLQEAAVRQGAVPKVPVVAGGGTAVAEVGGALGGGAVGMVAGLGVAGTIAGLAWLIGQSKEAQEAGHGGAWAPATFETRDTDEYALAEQKDRLGSLQARADQARAEAKFPDMPNPVLQQLDDEIADLKNQIAARERSLALVPQFPVGAWTKDGAPTMLGYGVQFTGKGGLTFPSSPVGAGIGGNSFLMGNAPGIGSLPAFLNPDNGGPLDIRPKAQRDAPLDAKWPSGTPQTIDVTGKVGADVNAKVDTVVKVEITAAPGIEARQTFQGTTTRVSTGPSMPNAGQAPHIGGIGHA